MCMCVFICGIHGFIYVQVLSLFPALIVDFLLIFAHFPQYLPAHFLRFMIRARSLPAIATDINIFELISTSHICQLSALRYPLSAICYLAEGGRD